MASLFDIPDAELDAIVSGITEAILQKLKKELAPVFALEARLKAMESRGDGKPLSERLKG